MKSRKIFEKILLCFDVIVIIYALIVIYRYVALTNLEKRGLEYAQKSNFKVEQEFNNDGYITKVFTKCDGNQVISKNINYHIDTNRLFTITEYISNSERYSIFDSNTLKTYSYEKIDDLSYNLDSGNLDLSFKDKLIIAVLGNIHKDNYDFKDAYYIKLDYPNVFGDEVIVDKETGLVVEQSTMQENLNTNPETGRYEKESYKYIQKFKYEFDTVKEGEIQKPDLTGYVQEEPTKANN